MDSPTAINMKRMIQDFSNASNLVYYWGYAPRILPCTSDVGSCAYLDVVYASHVSSVIYAGSFWALMVGITLGCAIFRRFRISASGDSIAGLRVTRGEEVAGKQTAGLRGGLSTKAAACRATLRAYLLPDAARAVFGHTTRLQVLVLFLLVAYLTVFSFVGIVYSTWYSQAKGQPEGMLNTRTSLGPWADRVGVLAYMLTPLSVLLASRESLLSVLTGLPYTSFMFLHRWTGHLVLFMSLAHTLGWVLVYSWLYKPQPLVWNTTMAEAYMKWGFAALAVLTALWFLSLRTVVSRVTGYEVFRKLHYVLVVAYIFTAIGHWAQLQCFLVPGLVLWVADRGARLVRTALLHYNPDVRWGFEPATARARLWRDHRGHVLRLDFELERSVPWQIGQHFYLCFAEGSLWQSHPFTPLSLPVAGPAGVMRHSYVVRARQGETGRMASLLEARGAGEKTEAATTPLTTGVIVQGPYGVSIVDGLRPWCHVLCVAGGTGITFVLPVLLRISLERAVPDRAVELVWVARRRQDFEWVAAELDELRAGGGVTVTLKCTGEDEAGNPLDGGRGHRPDLSGVVSAFVEGLARGPTAVFGSGPPAMLSDLRKAVASCNSGPEVWRGKDQRDVTLVCDDRMEG